MKNKKEISVDYYDNGQLGYKKHFLNKKLHGLYQEWSKNGQIIEEYNYENGKKNGPFKTWNSDGTVQLVGFYLSGDLHGEYLDYYNDGTLYKKCFYNKGALVGFEQVFDSVEKLEYLRQFRKGNFHGVFIQFDKKEYQGISGWFGGLNFPSFGPTFPEYGIDYHDNGKLKHRITFVNGKKNGLAKYFNKEGNLVVEKKFKNNLLNGTCKTWNDNKELEEILQFKNGGSLRQQHGVKVVFVEKNLSIDERLPRLLDFARARRNQ